MPDSPTALYWLVQCGIFTPCAVILEYLYKKYLALTPLTPRLLVRVWSRWGEVVKGGWKLVRRRWGAMFAWFFPPSFNQGDYFFFPIRVLAAPTSSLVAAVKTSSDYSAPQKLGLILEPGRGQEVRSSPVSRRLFKRLFQFPSVKQLAPRGGKANTKRVPLLHHQFSYTCRGYGRLFCWCSGY